MSTFGSNKYPYGTSQVKLNKAGIAERIRDAGTAKNFNASSLSKTADIPRSTMQKYWSGDRMLGCEYLFSITDILEVNPRWLITGLGSAEPVVEFDPENAEAEERLLRAFRRLSDKERQHVVENAELLSNSKTGKWPSKDDRSHTVHAQQETYKANDSD